MRFAWFTFLVLAACAGDPVEMLDFDAGPLTDAAMTDSMALDADLDLDGGDVDDGGTVEDAGADGGVVTVDSGHDAGEVPEDAGPPEEDAGPPVDRCPGGTYDPTGDMCIHRFRYVDGPRCGGEFIPLEWTNIEHQRELQRLLEPVGSGGTGLARNLSGTWRFLTSGDVPSRVAWAPGHPQGAEPNSYFSSDGLRSNNRAYTWQYCMRSPL